jgi:hypothetical protein
MPASRQSEREPEHRAQREAVDLVRLLRRHRAARSAEEGDAEGLDEAGGRQRRRQREQAPTAGTRILSPIAAAAG